MPNKEKEIKCKKCRWLYCNVDVMSCSSQSSLYRGIIYEDDDLIDYDKCTDFTPLAEFEDEEFEKSLIDNETLCIEYE